MNSILKQTFAACLGIAGVATGAQAEDYSFFAGMVEEGIVFDGGHFTPYYDIRLQDRDGRESRYIFYPSHKPDKNVVENNILSQIDGFLQGRPQDLSDREAYEFTNMIKIISATLDRDEEELAQRAGINREEYQGLLYASARAEVLLEYNDIVDPRDDGIDNMIKRLSYNDGDMDRINAAVKEGFENMGRDPTLDVKPLDPMDLYELRRKVAESFVRRGLEIARTLEKNPGMVETMAEDHYDMTRIVETLYQDIHDQKGTPLSEGYAYNRALPQLVTEELERQCNSESSCEYSYFNGLLNYYNYYKGRSERLPYELPRMPG